MARTVNEELQEQFLKVKLDIEQARVVFYPRNERSRVNSRYCQQQQWDEEEIAAFEVQKRIPYVFDQISPKINHLIGTEKTTRLDAGIVPMEQGDEEVAALLNKMVKWAEQMNHIEQVQSAVFNDMVKKAVGWVVVRWAMKDIVNGFPSVERIPVYQMMWDLSSVEADGSDMKWMCRLMPVRQSEALEMYPDYEDIINACGTDSGSFLGLEITEVMTDRQRWETVYNFGERYHRGGFLLIAEYYEKVKDYEYIVIDSISDKMLAFDTESEATKYADGLKDGYLAAGELLEGADGNELVFVSINAKDAFYQTLIVGETIAHRIAVDIPRFPFIQGFANFDDGDYWSPVDALIDPQRFYNRMISESDNQIGRANKFLTTVVESDLDHGWKVADVTMAKSVTGGVIPVRNHNAINNIPNLPASGEVMNMLNVSKEFMIESSGGMNALGLQENAAESGVAVRYRQQAAGTGRLELFENLRVWRRQVTEMIVWYMKNFLSDGQVLRIKGRGGEQEFIELDNGIMDTIRELSTDIVITEQPDTETSRQMQYAQVMEVFKVAGDTIPAELKLMVMLEMSDMEPRIKEKILSGIEFYQQYMQQKAQLNHDEKLKQQVADSIQRSQIKAEMLGEPQQPQGGEDANAHT